MPFPVKCSHCGVQLKAKESHIGKKIACPKCKNPFVVNAPERASTDALAAPPTSTDDPLAQSDLGNLGNLDLGSIGTLPTVGIGSSPISSSHSVQGMRPA